MKTAVLVYGPEFASSDTLVQALSLRGQVDLISWKGNDWREHPPGIVLAPDTLSWARQIVESADLIFLGDACAFKTLAKVAPDKDWEGWARTKRITGHFGDRSYYFNPGYYDGLCLGIGLRPMFLLPDLMHLAGIPAVPLHHAMPRLLGPKRERITVFHSPGTDGKSIQKGTEDINRVVYGLQKDFDFDYVQIMHMPLKTCREMKATGHIMIDQMPRPELGLTHGLGRSGLEGLAAGLVTFTALYDTDCLSGFFAPPPVVSVYTPNELKAKLSRVLASDKIRERLARSSVEWTRENIEPEAWMKYVERYL